MTSQFPCISSLTLRHLRLPLKQPYWSMITTLHDFDTLVAEVHLDDGSVGWGEAVIVQGYGHETLSSGLHFGAAYGPQLLRKTTADAIKLLQSELTAAPHAVTCLISALEMAGQHPLLAPLPQARRIPLLGAIATHDLDRIPDEVDAALSAGFHTLKVKVGQAVHDDLRRVACIQKTLAGRARIRIDANQGYSVEDAVHFVTRVDPAGIELFEQGCDAANWEAAVLVKEKSRVPVMLDESIFSTSDIDRAADLHAADYIKLKITKCGGVTELERNLRHIEKQGMTAVLGNGVATDLGNWMEACVADACVSTTGELNGFTRLRTTWLANPLYVEAGELVLPTRYYPVIDNEALQKHTIQSLRF